MSDWSVTIGGRASEVVYSEGSRSLSLESEVIVGPGPNLVIYVPNEIRWDPPHDDEEISAAQWDTIRRNIAEGLGKGWRLCWD